MSSVRRSPQLVLCPSGLHARTIPPFDILVIIAQSPEGSRRVSSKVLRRLLLLLRVTKHKHSQEQRDKWREAKRAQRAAKIKTRQESREEREDPPIPPHSFPRRDDVTSIELTQSPPPGPQRGGFTKREKCPLCRGDMKERTYLTKEGEKRRVFKCYRRGLHPNGYEVTLRIPGSSGVIDGAPPEVVPLKIQDP